MHDSDTAPVKASMIFHYPLPIESIGKSGSQVRPMQMFRAFREIGFEVETVIGYGRERSVAVDAIVRKMEAGSSRFAFIYSEATTQATLLTEPHHFPTHPFLDFGFFRKARKHGIPIGVFYRDIYWRTDLYTQNVSLSKRMIAVPFYYYDLIRYRSLVDHIFLPSLAMAEQLPLRWDANKISALPPGSNIVEINGSRQPNIAEGVHLLFVGGILPPLYDLRATIAAVSNVPYVRMTICCREADWKEFHSVYEPLPANVFVVHKSGNELKDLYETCHVVIVLHEYWYHKFSMPVKFFESVGFGRPAIILGHSELGDLVQREGIGWNIGDASKLTQVLEYMVVHPGEYAAVREKLLSHQSQHTWKSRARSVESIMLRKNPAP